MMSGVQQQSSQVGAVDDRSHWLPDPNAEPALRDITVADLFDEAADKFPDQEALVYSAYDEPEFSLRLTFAQMRERALKVAAALIGSGLKPADKAVVWATGVPQHPLIQIACAYANVTMVPINPLYRLDDLAYVLQKVRPQAIFALPYDRGTSLWGLIDQAAQGIDELKLRVALGPAVTDGSLAWNDWLQAAGDGITVEDVLTRRSKVRPADLSQIQFTSGTTGFPKGVELPNHTLANQAIQMATRAGMQPGDRIVNPMPLFHCGGCVLAALAAAAVGCTHLPIITFDARKIIDTIDSEQGTYVYGVPTMLLAIEEEMRRGGGNLSSLRIVVGGGSVVPPMLASAWRERLGVQFVITYGQTEHGPLATFGAPTDPPHRQTTTVGRPIPHTELDVVVPGTTERVPTGSEGEIRYRGYVMRGYHRDPEATLRAVSADGWLASGDLGRIDREGYVQITGRAKEMIIRGGENISPASSENALRRFDAVADVCVIGVPDKRLGEELCAFVRLNDGAAIDPIAVCAELSGRIVRNQIPRYFVTIDEFPTTPSGKIQRFKLAELYRDAQENGTAIDTRA